MNRIGIHPTGQRLRSLAMLRMNSTQSGVVQKNTGSVITMIQTPAAPCPHQQRSIRRYTIRRHPALTLNPLPLRLRNRDLMLATTAAAVVTAPVLQHRQQHRNSTHAAPIEKKLWRDARASQANFCTIQANRRRSSDHFFGVVQVPSSSAMDVFFSLMPGHCGAISAFSAV